MLRIGVLWGEDGSTRMFCFVKLSGIHSKVVPMQMFLKEALNYASSLCENNIAGLAFDQCIEIIEYGRVLSTLSTRYP